jgi:hypothetical protein
MMSENDCQKLIDLVYDTTCSRASGQYAEAGRWTFIIPQRSACNLEADQAEEFFRGEPTDQS